MHVNPLLMARSTIGHANQKDRKENSFGTWYEQNLHDLTIKVSYIWYEKTSPIQAELLAISLQLAVDENLVLIHICSDSSQANSMIMNNHVRFNNLISECR